MSDGARPELLDDWLLARLVCPATRTPLRYDAARGLLISDAAGRGYPVRDGVPILLVEAAVLLDDETASPK
ncbi:Trm112 family protein [Sphingomonas sp. DT-51]|uniref:Trm112 family protein n=1 Tax=Sphingomonas sp. DT-51 TaxID=3396165 RepID=UPI003F1D3344